MVIVLLTSHSHQPGRVSSTEISVRVYQTTRRYIQRTVSLNAFSSCYITLLFI